MAEPITSSSSHGLSERWWRQLRLSDVAGGTVVVLLVVLGFAVLLAARNVLVGIFLGVMVATGLRPVMGWLQRVKLPRAVAASLALALLLAIVAGIGVLVVPLALQQVRSLSEALPELLDGLRRELASSRLALVRQLGAQIGVLQTRAAGADSAQAAAAAAWLTAAAPQIGYALLFTASTLLFAYYWLLYRDRSVGGLLLMLAPERRDVARGLWESIEERVGAFVRGQITLGVVTGICSLVGYWLIGLPYALVLALIAGLLEFIPYLGALLASGLAVAVGLSVSTELGLLALLAGLIIQQIENNVLAPRIMAHAVGVSPVVTLLAFVGFTALFGPLGGFVAVPLAAALQLLFGAWADRQSLESMAGEGRDQAAALRYQVADLAQDLTRRLRERPEADTAPNDDPEEQIEAVLVALRDLIDRSEEAKTS